MKKNAVILTLLLLASIAGTYGVYELYVKARMRELGEHLEEEKQLQTAIARLEETFYGTKPEAVLQVWREQSQPWVSTVGQRSKFYSLGDIPLEIEIPEEEFPKFYYRKIFPKMVEELENAAWQANVSIPDPTFGNPRYDYYGTGSNPSAEEISKHLVHFEFGKSIAELLIEASVRDIRTLSIWPEQVEIEGRNGNVLSRTTGLSFTISVRDLVLFLDKLSQESRYFEVKTLRITNKKLRIEDPLLDVQLVLSQAYYKPAEVARDIAGGDFESTGDFAALMGNFFGGGEESTDGDNSSNKGKGGLLERIKGWFSWLPFI